MSVKSDFASIYQQWENSHNEKAAIDEQKRLEQANEKTNNKITQSELKRMKVQDELDLHEFTVDEAINATKNFLEKCRKRGLVKVRLITGKGLHSPNGLSQIRPEIIQLLKRTKNIQSVNEHPLPIDGGTGALIVILKH